MNFVSMLIFYLKVKKEEMEKLLNSIDLGDYEYYIHPMIFIRGWVRKIFAVNINMEREN